jgi:sugar phosphate isomerase/epimerase
MPCTTRRECLKTTSALALSGVVPTPFPYAGQGIRERKFKLCLNPGTIGVAATQQELLRLAIRYGYEAIISMPDQLRAFSDTERTAFVGEMEEHGISWGSTNLPVEFRRDEATFSEGLEALPAAVAALERFGATRMNTWVMPFHQELTYTANFEQHARRLGACAEILVDHGVRLGLEYVGPKTTLVRGRYPFLRTMAETRELIAAIGAPNLGLVLDSFHWYCAADTVADIQALDPSEIVTCDLNDARADLSRDEQIDGTRELPGATGLIDLKGFLGALEQIGYAGPVRAEPFNQALRDMEDEEAVKVTYEAMSRAFALIDQG